MKILYATDLDRTVIFSKRFIDEYEPSCNYEVAETKDDRVISYISSEVKGELFQLNSNKDVEIVPITSRSYDEFKRINIGLQNKYNVICNGGTILVDGEPMQEWEELVNKNIDKMELMNVALDLSELSSVEREPKLIDGKYIFTKVSDEQQFDIEVAQLILKYGRTNFTRQGKKVYAIPVFFSKAVALRWLQHIIHPDKTVACGDSELDLPMLALADYATIPEHGSLIKDKFITEGRIAEAGINASLYPIDIIKGLLKSK